MTECPYAGWRAQEGERSPMRVVGATKASVHPWAGVSSEVSPSPPRAQVFLCVTGLRACAVVSPALPRDSANIKKKFKLLL